MVHRSAHKNNFTIITNTALKDIRLTLKARGLLVLMLSLPDDWKYSVRGLCAVSGEGTTAITSALSELEKTGYLRRVRVSDRGRFCFVYEIYETPADTVPENETAEETAAQHAQPAAAAPENEPDSREKAPENNAEFDAALSDYCRMRRDMGKPLGKNALKGALNRLSVLSPDTAVRTEILRQSVRKHWVRLYPLEAARTDTAASYMTRTSPDDCARIERLFFDICSASPPAA